MNRRIASALRYASATVLAGLLLAVLSVMLFAWLGEEVLENDTARFDNRVRALVHAEARPSLTEAMKVTSDVGSPIAVSVWTLAAFAIFWKQRKRRDALSLAATVLGASIVDYVLKISFHRVRPVPFFSLPTPLTFSFPSGHSMLAFCFYTALAYLLCSHTASAGKRVAIWIAAVAIFLLIGLSRIYLGVHYPSDVIAGYAAGSVWVATLYAAEQILKERASISQNLG
ncbi:MAG: phosphatase PAP2 family protein [Acidobacteriota bacterium]|nr:phosphatase PAP2 family protein [Acidobacteriota bacterium]